MIVGIEGSFRLEMGWQFPTHKDFMLCNFNAAKQLDMKNVDAFVQTNVLGYLKNNMKDQQKSYKASLDKKTSTRREAGSMNQPGRGGDQSGRSGGKIVCTMMNESYGFGSFRNKIWLRHSKNLAPEYQIGYHRIFLPLVKKAKTNKTLKKILEHIAIHRTIDIRQEERNKIHLIGRVYRTILEPICYWAGKK